MYYSWLAGSFWLICQKFQHFQTCDMCLSWCCVWSAMMLSRDQSQCCHWSVTVLSHGLSWCCAWSVMMLSQCCHWSVTMLPHGLSQFCCHLVCHDITWPVTLSHDLSQCHDVVTSLVMMLSHGLSWCHMTFMSHGWHLQCCYIPDMSHTRKYSIWKGIAPNNPLWWKILMKILIEQHVNIKFNWVL